MPGNLLGSLKVNTVKVVFGDHIKDGLDELGAVRRGDRRREIGGTSPSADRDTSHRTMLLSLCNERRDDGVIRGIDLEDRGICGGGAKNRDDFLASWIWHGNR